MLSIFFLIIQSFVVIYIFILLISLIYNIISRQFIVKNVRAFLKETILRHREGKYSYYETHLIKKICSDDIYPYYFIYCANYNVWQDLENRLEPDEIVDEISSSYFNITQGLKVQFLHGVIFKTSKLRFFIYKLNWSNLTKAKTKHLLSFSLQDIKEVDYEINLKIGKIIKYCLPSKNHYLLNNKTKLTIVFGCALTIERLKEELWKYQQLNNIAIKDPDVNLNILERQDKRLKVLLQTKKINETLYQELMQKAAKTPKEIMECYYEEFSEG